MPAALTSVMTIVLVAAGAMIIATAGHRVLRRLGRHSDRLRDSELLQGIFRRTYWPTTLMIVLLAARLAVPTVMTGQQRELTIRLIMLTVICLTGWLVGALLRVVADAALHRFPVDVEDNLAARRVHTQITMIRRVGLVVTIIVTMGAMLVTFPQARAAGASLLASAGLLGVVAALAAQSMLGNIFAGIQLAFSNGLRLDDVVVVEGEWGRVEEMALGYVVVRIWDERRLVLPSSYFTTTPFQTWTRTSASILGTVEMDVDWSTSIQHLREELHRIVQEQSEGLWDGRVCCLQVTDATSSGVQVRSLVSAASSSACWDLRCLVRERLIGWVQQHHPTARPRVRSEIDSVPVRHHSDLAARREILVRHAAGASAGTRG